MLRHIAFRTEIRLDAYIQGAVVLQTDNKDAHYLDVSRIQTSEGIDLSGLLPTENMVQIKDEMLCQAQLDAEAEIVTKMLPPVDLTR